MYNYYSVFNTIDYHQDSMSVYVNIVNEVCLHNRIHSIIGASVSEPPLVDSTDALSR